MTTSEFYLPFSEGDPLYAEQVNVISNHVHDGQTHLVGHADFIHDTELSNDSGQIKPNFYGWFNRIKVTPPESGFMLSYTPGRVLIANNLVEIPGGQILANQGTNTFIFISEQGVIAKATSLPNNCVPIALVTANQEGITGIHDLRAVNTERLIPIPQVPPIPTGVVQMFMGNVPPSGWLLLNGQVVSKAAHPALYNLLVSQLGANLVQTDTTFTLPNFTNRSPIGGSLGATGGASQLVIGAANLPAHNHPIQDVQHTHMVADSGHAHALAQEPHSHGIHDPGHFHTYQLPHGTRGERGTWQPTQYHNRPDSVTPHIHPVDVQRTGVSVIPSQIPIAVHIATSNVANMPSGTGLTQTGFTGNGQPIQYRSPFIGVNFIIKT